METDLFPDAISELGAALITVRQYVRPGSWTRSLSEQGIPIRTAQRAIRRAADHLELPPWERARLGVPLKETAGRTWRRTTDQPHDLVEVEVRIFRGSAAAVAQVIQATSPPTVDASSPPLIEAMRRDEVEPPRDHPGDGTTQPPQGPAGTNAEIPTLTGAAHRLEAMLTAFMETVPVKPTTKVTYEQTRLSLLNFFEPDRDIRSITPLDADRWREWMKSDDGRRRGKGKLAAATISKRIKTARQIFRQAVRWKLITENPFAEMKAGQQRNRERMRFIPAEDIEIVLNACPDTTWKTIVALARYGGLRCSSEIERLRWKEDIDWERGRMIVRSPKTEAADSEGVRTVPLYPELRAYLHEHKEASPIGAVHVVDPERLRGTRRKNLGTQLRRIIKSAGLKPWPRLFQNLRASRQTELCQRFPAHVVAEWQGNSEAVAREHYLLTTDRDFAAALLPHKPQQ